MSYIVDIYRKFDVSQTTYAPYAKSSQCLSDLLYLHDRANLGNLIQCIRILTDLKEIYILHVHYFHMCIQSYHTGQDARNLKILDTWPESSNSDSTKFLGKGEDI